MFPSTNKFMPLENSRGFTLLEMIISIGIFSVVVIASIGIMLQVSNAQIKAAGIQAIQDNIRFSLELMTKELRTGNSYQLTTICSTSGSEITFDATSGRRTYFLDSNKKRIMRATQVIGVGDCDGSTSKAIPFTSDEVSVENFLVQLEGQNAGPLDGQPRVSIMLKVSANDPKFGKETSMNLQTTIVQRLRDL